MSNTLIIAEAGVNHNGDEDLAFALVDVAVSAGADAIKFQTFKASQLAAHGSEKAAYQRRNTNAEESQLEMLKRLELPYSTHIRLESYCRSKGIEFLSTAFDFESLRFLTENIQLNRLKLPSGELTNGPLILEHARTGLDLIVSTGMASLTEVEKALEIIAFGYLARTDQKPTRSAFREAFKSEAGQKMLKQKVTLLHCTTEYPAPARDINLMAMDTLRAAFKCKVGYSDHSEGIVVSVAAAARGASIIEKHFTLDKSLPGPDHRASLEPDELIDLIEKVRFVDLILGDGTKEARPSELKNIAVARKSLVAAKKIKRGEVFDENNLTLKRPGHGISPMYYWDVLGEAADKDFDVDEVISRGRRA